MKTLGFELHNSPAPAGWHELKGAATAPTGYAWYSNGESRFSGHYEHGCYRKPVIDESGICNSLQEAWRNTTKTDNFFQRAVESVPWQETWQADGEIYYTLESLMFIITSLDVFAPGRNPMIIFSSGEFYEFRAGRD